MSTPDKPVRRGPQPRNQIFCVGKCKFCGEAFTHPIEAATCCVLAPKPTGWCAWCGKDVPGGRVFCDGHCRVDFFNDRPFILKGLKHEPEAPRP